MKCQKCNLTLIEEELKNHECIEAKGFRIEGNILWLSDGMTEYPLKLEDVRKKLTNRNFTSTKSTAEWTEPVFWFCQVSGTLIKIFYLSKVGT